MMCCETAILLKTFVPTAVSKCVFCHFFTVVTYYKAPPGPQAAFEVCPIDHRQQEDCLCR